MCLSEVNFRRVAMWYRSTPQDIVDLEISSTVAQQRLYFLCLQVIPAYQRTFTFQYNENMFQFIS